MSLMRGCRILLNYIARSVPLFWDKRVHLRAAGPDNWQTVCGPFESDTPRETCGKDYTIRSLLQLRHFILATSDRARW